MSSYESSVKESRVVLMVGDITEADVDAIVNAANPSLMGGGGVDGAIHRKGGSRILEECKKLRATGWPKGLPTGRAVITSGGELKARHVIHTVGPVWRGGSKSEAALLADAYWNSLKLAVAEGLRTVAFPSISTGAYGYPIENASHVALETVKQFLEKGFKLDKVVFVLFTQHDFQVYKRAARAFFGGENHSREPR